MKYASSWRRISRNVYTVPSSVKMYRASVSRTRATGWKISPAEPLETQPLNDNDDDGDGGGDALHISTSVDNRNLADRLCDGPTLFLASMLGFHRFGTIETKY